MANASTSAALSEEIDKLLEYYLSLLDQYTTLRSELSSLQSSVYQNISRANFSAERGIRYGADFYDARMQAIRVCRITVPAIALATAEASRAQQDSAVEGQSLNEVERDTGPEVESLRERGRQDKASNASMVMGTACFMIAPTPNNDPSVKDVPAAAHENGTKITKVAQDPLRMFGLLTPSALREAQRGSFKTLEEIIPKIASVDAEMKEVEIRIRRARKWKAKAQAKEGNVTENGRHEIEQKQQVVA